MGYLRWPPQSFTRGYQLTLTFGRAVAPVQAGTKA